MKLFAILTKLKHVLMASLATMTFVSCASFQSYDQLADYDRDGLVSDAEYKQYMKQKNVEDRAVYSESTKRRNAVNTVRDGSDAIRSARNAKWMLENF